MIHRYRNRYRDCDTLGNSHQYADIYADAINAHGQRHDH